MAILQGTDSQTYADIAAGCYYGTSALLHEVVEVRILLERDRWLLARSRQQIKKFLQDNEDAHIRYVLDPMREREEAQRSVLSYEVPAERSLAVARAVRETKGDDE